MTRKKISSGLMHEVPLDFEIILSSDTQMLDAWEDITLLARNEWLCWIESAKKQETRILRMSRACDVLKKGKRRPCCWPGCPHRKNVQ